MRAVPTSIWTICVELEGFRGVNTVSRQLEGFNEEKGGGCFRCTLAAVWAYSSPGNGRKVGVVSSGFLVNVPLFMGRAG